MKERIINKIIILIVVLGIILSAYFVVSDLYGKINTISEENKQFIGDKEFYAGELGEIKDLMKELSSKIDYQTSIINKTIDDKFNEGFNCNFVE